MGETIFLQSAGAAAPAGIGGLEAGRLEDFIEDVPADLGAPPGTRAARVKELPLARFFPNLKTYVDRCSALALVACRAAFEAAGATICKPPPLDEGLALGTDWGCLDTLDRYAKKVAEAGFRLAPPFLFTHAYANAPNGLVAIELGLGGYNTNLGGEHGGLAALAFARRALLRGRARRLLAGGVEAVSAPRLKFHAAAGRGPAGEAAVFFAVSGEAGAAPVGALLGTGFSGRSPARAAVEEAARKALGQAGAEAGGLGFAAAGSGEPGPFAEEAAAIRSVLPPEAPILQPALRFGETGAAKGPLGILAGLYARRTDPALASRPPRFLVTVLDPGGAAGAAVVEGV